MNILHIDSSISGEKSVSRPLTAAAAEHLKQIHPTAKYIYRDLVDDNLSLYTGAIRFQSGAGAAVTGQQQAELDKNKEVLEEFLAADLVLIGAPMYNFTVPSQLKTWIDMIVVPGTTFKYGENGPTGTCDAKKIAIISTRGGMYGPGSPFESNDFQEKYLRAIFGFLGVKDITVITAEGVAMGPEKVAEAISNAKAKIAELR